MIRTLKGDIRKEELGWCQCHEHLFVKKGPAYINNEALCLDDFDKSLSEAKLYRAAGGRSLIDCQPGNFSRMAANLIKVSVLSDINIILTTGFHKLSYAENSDIYKILSAKEIANLFVQEIRKDIIEDGRTVGARAGIIKCAVDSDNSNEQIYEKLFESAAIAAVETGAPIIIHFDSGTDALRIIDYFKGYDIAPERLILCHLDRARYDFTYHEEVAGTGAYLEYDTINRLKYHSNEKEIELIAHMIDKGHGKSLLLGMDPTNKRLKSYGADFGLDYILTDFQYQMREFGIKQSMIENIMLQNAANALDFK